MSGFVRFPSSIPGSTLCATLVSAMSWGRLEAMRAGWPISSFFKFSPAACSNTTLPQFEEVSIGRVTLPGLTKLNIATTAKPRRGAENSAGSLPPSRACAERSGSGRMGWEAEGTSECCTRRTKW
jgi:hypothetical protein